MTLGDITIRDYNQADESALVELVRDLQRFEQPIYDRLVPPDQIGPWHIDLLKALNAQHAGSIRVAIRNGVAVGYATILTDVEVSEEPGEITYCHAYLGELFVAETERGNGVGQQLIADCEEIARRAGARWLRISALAGNARARRIYAAYGFKEHVVTFEKPLQSLGETQP